MKEYRGVYYFPSYDAARAFAKRNGFPSDRIIHYQRGFAIQLKVSGPYVGKDAMKKNPTKRAKPRTAAQKAATARLVAFMKAKRGGSTRARTIIKKRIRHLKTPTRKTRTLRPRGGKFAVQVHRDKAWVTLGSFSTMTLAREYARALQHKYPSKTIRIFW